MKVILKQNVPSLGKAGMVVKVNDGYARNFLIPKGLAVEANEKNIKVFEHERKSLMEKLAKQKKDAQAMAEVLSGLTITFSRKVGDQGKLFGSVTVRDIESALKEKGFDIDRKMIVHAQGEHIKDLGEHKVRIKLAQGVEAEIKVKIIGEP
jgi:large subunit ribosomal protein L9